MKPGFRFGHYEIRRELGRGAMGVVYEAFDTATQRTIALKVLHGLGAGDDMTAAVADEVRERFRREGQVAGQLVHPNIVAVYDSRDRMPLEGGQDGPPYLVMEFVEGGDLKSRIARKARFTSPQVAQVMGQLLGALHYAHQRGVIHRDVKPANVLMRENGRLKLTDFGIARVAGSELTQTGEVMGTLTYMSPEQLTGMAIDARADLYSCGVIFYELLTGEAPFVGAATTIMQKILNQEPLPPSKLNPGLPRALDEVVRKALSKRPDARYADAPAFERAIAHALFDEDDQATLVRPAAASPAPTDDRADPDPHPDAAPAGAHAEVRSSKAGIVLAGVVGAAALVAIVVGLSVPRFGAIASENQRAAIAPSLTAARTPIAAAAAPALPRPAGDDAAGLHSPQEVERMAWDHARAADSAAAYKAYVAAYPDGAYVKLAQVHLAVLAQHPRIATAPDTASGTVH